MNGIDVLITAAGITAVNEGAKYPDATIAEKYAGNTTFSKRGVMVQVTEETIQVALESHLPRRVPCVLNKTLRRVGHQARALC